MADELHSLLFHLFFKECNSVHSSAVCFSWFMNRKEMSCRSFAEKHAENLLTLWLKSLTFITLLFLAVEQQAYTELGWIQRLHFYTKWSQTAVGATLDQELGSPLISPCKIHTSSSLLRDLCRRKSEMSTNRDLRECRGMKLNPIKKRTRKLCNITQPW